jgi:predicted nucleic acid-binding protein
VYLWDTNILRHFAEGHPVLQEHLRCISWAEIALPSVTVAEVLRGRCEFALKATPDQAPLAHRLLMETRQLLQQFNVIVFDRACADELIQLQRATRTRKRYADAMIAATARAGRHIVVTRNQTHFADLLSPNQLVNWIDAPPQG